MKIVKNRGWEYELKPQVGLGQIGICKGCEFDRYEKACIRYSNDCNPNKYGNQLVFKKVLKDEDNSQT